MVNKKITISGVEFNNPIIPASGTFGFGHEFAEYYDINCLGGISLKGSTYNERFGNELPRVAECASGLINAIGLQNPGIEKVLNSEIPKLKKVYDGVVIANISGFAIDEYKKTCELANSSKDIDIIELNISCPNVHGGGLSFGATSEMAYKVCKEVKSVISKPLYVKLSPNVTNIAEIAKACEEAGADGISLINTLMGMRIDINKSRPVLANTTGGLSGAAIFPVALRMVWQVHKKVNIPIMGMGGVSCAKDVIEMMMAGASVVQIGAANLVNPYACKEIIEDLDKLCSDLGIESLEDIVGKAHVGRKE